MLKIQSNRSHLPIDPSPAFGQAESYWQYLAKAAQQILSYSSSTKSMPLYVATERKRALDGLLPLSILGSDYTVRLVSTLDPFNGLNVEEPSILLVDMESFGGIDHVIDFLLSFRMQNPSVPVVICSDRFHVSEGGGERAFVCDFSLRIPCQGTTLTEALNSARTHRLNYHNR